MLLTKFGYNRTIFKWVSKEIGDWFFFCFTSLWLIGKKKNSRHSLNQSDAKLKPNTSWSPAFFPRFRQFACFHFEFSLAFDDNFLSSPWPLWLLWFWFYETQLKSALHIASSQIKNFFSPFCADQELKVNFVWDGCIQSWLWSWLILPRPALTWRHVSWNKVKHLELSVLWDYI